jgi:glycerate kinase
MKIVIASDSFKGSLSNCQICSIISDEIKKVNSNWQIVQLPMADGGEGTCQCLLEALNGSFIPMSVTGPLLGTLTIAGFGWIQQPKMAVVEMAKASGLELLTEKQQNPMNTTTFGTGQLIKTADKRNPDSILLAVGGSSTCDCGIGAAAALGYKFIDANGDEISPTGRNLSKIVNILPPDKKLNSKVRVLCDVNNPLFGPNGAACVYGPQKGADKKMVQELDDGLRHISKIITDQLNKDIAEVPGAGAAGGLSAGAMAFMNAELVSGIDTIIEYTKLDEKLNNADWVITGEGCFDNQSLSGKVIDGVLKTANKNKVKTAVIAGKVELDEQEYTKAGVAEAFALMQPNMKLSYAISNANSLLRKATRNFIKKCLVGN